MSDLYGPQLNAGAAQQQVCLAHQLRDLQYVVDRDEQTSGFGAYSLTYLGLAAALVRPVVAVREHADGTTTDWTFTTGSATTLADRGISKVGPNALKVGEPLTAKFIPARNGNPLGFLKSITRADGTTLNISAGNPND